MSRQQAKPIYELVADERFRYLVKFGDYEPQSREDEVIDFLRRRFYGRPEYTLTMSRQNSELGKLGLSSVIDLSSYSDQDARTKPTGAELTRQTIHEYLTMNQA